jgi:hypothetical protein
MKNYDRIEFCHAVIKVSVMSNISMEQAFLLSFEKAKEQKIKTGFIVLLPEAWDQYRKFIANNKHIFSKNNNPEQVDM